MLTVITGPPCAGKTTYARQHALPGDVVIDFDALAQALSTASPHGYAEKDPVWRVAVAARDAAIAEALKQHRRGARVLVIDARPPAARRQQYRGATATFVDLTASREELHRRADADGRPPRWHERIDRWYDDPPRPDPGPRARTRW